MIDLTHDGLNTSVSVEESNFLEKFIDSDVPEVGGKNKSVASSLHGRQDSSHKTKSIASVSRIRKTDLLEPTTVETLLFMVSLFRDYRKCIYTICLSLSLLRDYR